MVNYFNNSIMRLKHACLKSSPICRQSKSVSDQNTDYQII